jgi:beta-mannosidase
MRHTLDLSTLTWTLTGWHPHHGTLRRTAELGTVLPPLVGPVPARVPGSVQQALLTAGLVPDWNVGTNSLACEWVEHRDWSFETHVPLDALARGASYTLLCSGLDHAGEVRLGSDIVGMFDSAFVPHRFDLTPAINRYRAVHPQAESISLTIVFTPPPRALGQINYTSRIREQKPRFNYVWDWVPRIVQTGVWDSICIESVRKGSIQSLRLWTEYDPESSAGDVRGEVVATDGASVRVAVTDGEHVVASQTIPQQPGTIDLRCGEVRAWHPHAVGDSTHRQPLYTVRVTLHDAAGEELDARSLRVGFRLTEWTPCEASPPGAAPWLLRVNGSPVFLFGANWVPIRATFADVTVEEYRDRLTRYRDFGFNLLRVWGGAVLEREVFYELCDELGILVWQEMPLSSSGLDNWPPEDEEFARTLACTAESYVIRRQHHPSLLCWCGGNELQWGLDDPRRGGGVPIGLEHPTLAEMADVVERLDHARRFIPTSPQGPRFSASEAEFGKGLHHCVHGPWNLLGTMDDWRRYCANDDALFRTETGMPGASPAHLLLRYSSGAPLPGDHSNPAWRHVMAWWVQWDAYLLSGGVPTDLDAYVNWSQTRQATALAIVLDACRGRFPRCGGFVVWMGHDCFPCPVNTSVFDVDGQPKPAAFAMRDVMCRYASTSSTSS